MCVVCCVCVCACVCVCLEEGLLQVYGQFSKLGSLFRAPI